MTIEEIKEQALPDKIVREVKGLGYMVFDIVNWEHSWRRDRGRVEERFEATRVTGKEEDERGEAMEAIIIQKKKEIKISLEVCLWYHKRLKNWLLLNEGQLYIYICV